MANILLILLAALWTCLWLLVSLLEITATLHDPTLRWWQLAELIGPSVSVPALWLAFWFGTGAFRRIPLDRPGKWFLLSLAASPILAAGSIVTVHGGRTALFALAGGSYGHLPWPGLIPYEFFKVTLFQMLWLGFAFGAKSFVDWQEQGQRLLQSQRELAEAQLAQLREQLRPHFLFNTLNTISALMQSDVARADRLMARLADLLRSSLSFGDQSMVPLETELRFLELYADIMTERFSGRVVVDWRIDPAVRSVAIPALLLQPLLENAFRHGIEEVAGAHRILIAAGMAEETAGLEISIHCSGGRLKPDAKDGVGLRNCRRRLGIHYGQSAGLTLSPAPSGGVTSTLTLPLPLEPAR